MMGIHPIRRADRRCLPREKTGSESHHLRICVSIGRGRHKHMIVEHQNLAEKGARLAELSSA
jgi:hypothetical protein